MKKLMIALAAVACATGVQAASVNWGAAVADPSDSTGNTEAAVGNVAYLLYSSTALSAIATSLDGTGVGATANNGATVVDTYTLTSADTGGSWNFSTEYIAANVNGYYQILMVDESNNKFGAVDQTFQVTGIDDTTAPGEVLYNMDGSLGFDKFAGETGWSGTVSTGGGSGGVPEPTSGLLLLLGVAGLALKRKVA